MTSVLDVADFILEQQGEMTAMKLQKLCYYSHAWHLVWEEQPLFPEPIEAWANGPVIRVLYNAHRRQFRVEAVPGGDGRRLTEGQRTTVEAVLSFYGPMGAHQLSELTHSERPWQDAREGLPAGVRSESVITDSSMAAYYDSLTTVSA